MRLRRLDLERYGPFTGRSLDFSQAARLTLVYGPNEAGKSSALAAITDLLFGFEHRVSNDFLHDARELRVGAELQAADGATISFRRRRGNKNTIVDAGDGPLPDDCLLPFLGSVTRDVFTRAFGLSTEALRSGAEEMLKSEGDVGATLFAAASGLKGLNDLRRGLEQEAEGIFAQRASQNRRFYQALQRHDDARRAIRESELRAADWKALNQRIDELQAHLDQTSKARREAVEERTRLARLKRVAPCLRLIDQALSDLEALGPLPDVPADFTARLKDRLAAAERARDACRRVGEDRARADEAHARVSVDRDLLASAAEIGDLVARSGACASSRRDLPRVQAEADEKARDLDALAARLGFPGRAEMEAARPTDAAQTAIELLLGEGRELRRAAMSRQEGLAAAKEEMGRLRREREARGHVADPRPLQERLAALQPELRRLEQLAPMAAEAETAARALREEAARLSPAVDLEAIAAVPLPAAETIERFRSAFEASAEEGRRTAERLDEARAALARLDDEIGELASGRPVPSAEAIAEVRGRRDGIWRSLRGTLLGEAGAVPPEGVAGAVAGFEGASGEADALADEAARDAERVARHAAAMRERARQAQHVGELDARLASQRERETARRGEWAALWAEVTSAPLSPAGMAEWCRSVAGLFERRAALAARQEEIASLEAAEARIVPVLRELAREVGVAGLDAAGALVLAGAVDERLKALARTWDEARETETRRRDIEARIADLEAMIAEGGRERDEWTARWRQAVPALGLGEAAGIEEAETALQVWRAVPGAIGEWEYRRRRIVGMERDIGSFETQLGELAARLCPDVSGASTEMMLQTLQDRLDAAKAARTRKAQAAERLEEVREAAAQADAELHRAEEALEESAALLPEGADLPAELDRLERRDALRGQLADRRRQLTEQGDGYAEARLREELRAFEPDAAEARMSELDAEEQRLDLELREVHSERDREIDRRTALETGVGAEIAALDRRAAEAELAAASREWMVLKLGALMISSAVERHRAGQQDPLMARAGELFATVTGGRFEGLAQDYDEADVPRLVGQRAGGQPVHISGMSEGTRDQLYLALRLAYLEDYARRAEPLPFVGDDLFTTFDDARTENGLKVLAAIGGTVQPILFTHHRRLVELAREALGGEVSVLELP